MKNKNNSQRVKTLDEKVRDRERRYSQNIRRTTEEKEKEDKLTINKWKNRMKLANSKIKATGSLE